MNTKEIGERSEAQVLAKLLKRGKTILIPFGDNQRYDLVVEDSGIFTRIQCKTGSLKNGSIRFPTSSTYAHRGGKRKDYRGQIEKFGVYCPDNDGVYIVPVDDIPIREGSLRISAPKNSQEKNIRWAKNYEL